MTNEQLEYGGGYVKCLRCGVLRPPSKLKAGVCSDGKCAEVKP